MKVYQLGKDEGANKRIVLDDLQIMKHISSNLITDHRIMLIMFSDVLMTPNSFTVINQFYLIYKLLEIW